MGLVGFGEQKTAKNGLGNVELWWLLMQGGLVNFFDVLVEDWNNGVIL